MHNEKDLDYIQLVFDPTRQNLVDDYFNKATARDNAFLKIRKVFLDLICNPVLVLTAAFILVAVNS